MPPTRTRIACSKTVLPLPNARVLLRPRRWTKPRKALQPGFFALANEPSRREPAMKRLDPKKEQLLKAVVKEHIHTANPVASLTLGGHHGIEASPATLRNWMSDLETL